MAPERFGRYEVVRRSGHGRLGELFHVVDPEASGHALILERVQLDALGSARGAFLAEARRLVELRAPGLIRVVDVGEDGNGMFVVREAPPGRDLLEVIRNLPPPNLGRRLRLVVSYCEALAEAHSHRFVDPNLSPRDAYVSGDDAIVFDATPGALWQIRIRSGAEDSGWVVGAIRYNAPEQLKGNNISARSNVFSAACIAYQCLTGQLPLSGDTPIAIAYKICMEPPKPPRELAPDIPVAVEEWLLAALAKDPVQRFPDGAALRDALSVALGQESRVKRPGAVR